MSDIIPWNSSNKEVFRTWISEGFIHPKIPSLRSTLNMLSTPHECFEFIEELLAHSTISKAGHGQSSEDFMMECIKKLSTLYRLDKDTYTTSLKEYTTPSSFLDSKDLSWTGYMLYSYLPTLYNRPQETKEALYTSVLEEERKSYSFHHNYMGMLLYAAKPFLDDLTELNPALTTFQCQATYCYEQPIEGYTGIKTDFYTHLKPTNPVKKTLIIHGFDKNGAFQYNEAIRNLVSLHHELLVIDARKTPVNTEMIKTALKNTDFSDLDEVHINMHGSNPLFVSDVMLSLNPSFSRVGPAHIMGSHLIEEIIAVTDNKPITLALRSCHSQLITHQIEKILPAGSQILTTSEDHYVQGKHYTINSHGEPFPFRNSDDLLRHAAERMFAYKYSERLASISYSQIGKCNFHSTANLSKTDITLLLSHLSKHEVIKGVSTYLTQGGYFSEDEITANAKNFLEFFAISDAEQPLLERGYQSPSHSINQHMAIAQSIIGLYGACGAQILPDTDFTPNEDHYLASSLFALLPWLPPLLQDSIIKGADFLIDWMHSQPAAEQA